MVDSFSYPEPGPVPVEALKTGSSATLRYWLAVIRLPFLSLSITVVLLGAAMAWYAGFFNAALAGLTLLGLLAAHASVNVLNEYYDFKSGVDLHTARTPFSGGSGVIPKGHITPMWAFRLGIGLMLLAVAVGAYLIAATGPALIPIVLVGIICVALYNPVILKLGWAEWAPGLGLGSLAILGTFYVQTGYITWPIVIASIPSGILAHNLLLMNEFPDTEADREAGRRSLPIGLGPRTAALVYVISTSGVYLWIVIGVSLKYVADLRPMPVYCLIGLLTLPAARKAIKYLRQAKKVEELIPAMGANVAVVLVTQLLLGLGFILGRAL